MERPKINLEELKQIQQMLETREPIPSEIWMNKTMFELAMQSKKIVAHVGPVSRLSGLALKIDDTLPDGYFETDLERNQRISKWNDLK